MTADGLRLLQDLRRSMLDPPRQLRPHTVTVTQDDSRPENVSAIAQRHHETEPRPSLLHRIPDATVNPGAVRVTRQIFRFWRIGAELAAGRPALISD